MGILPEYVDISGVLRPTSDDTRVALLAAMGIDASNQTMAREALAALAHESAARLLAPVAVHPYRKNAGPRLRLNVPSHLSGQTADYQLTLRQEGGNTQTVSGTLRLPRRRPTVTLTIPGMPGLGYHRAALELRARGDALAAEQSVIVRPSSCVTTTELFHDRRLFGIWTHLYSLRRAEDWGVGDFTALVGLTDWSRSIGAAFVGLNPLHALRNSGYDVSPYSPVSRLFYNSAYLDIAAVPEFAECGEACALADSPEYCEALARLRTAKFVDYDAVMALKRPVLGLLHRTFEERHGRSTTERGRAYATFIGRHGPPLEDFATFLALSQHLGTQGQRDWRAWPADYRDPRSAAVRQFRRSHRAEIDLQMWIQFELDRQLGAAAASARRLPIGLYGDLAIGSAADGSDAWAFPGLFLSGAHVGSPPDDYSIVGQDWGLPPVDPRRLREDHYRYWILLLRSSLRHMGALRIDHVMGLFRQYWVPAGRPATEGAYVRYPANDLLGILALESQRHRALIIGEDLGTVPHALPSVLARWGILSSRVLYFQKDRRGRFRPSRTYSKRALVTANTHDQPPLAGYWAGRDIEQRREAGELASEEQLAAARAARAQERRALIARLAAERCLDSRRAPDSHSELCAAVHAFLSRTPAPLVGIRLDDLSGETESVNLPGIGMDRHQNWSRRLDHSLEQLQDDPEVRRALSGVADRRAPT